MGSPLPSCGSPLHPRTGAGSAAAPGMAPARAAGSPGTGLLCAQGEGRRFRQMSPVKIAAGIAKRGEDLL